MSLVLFLKRTVREWVRGSGVRPPSTGLYLPSVPHGFTLRLLSSESWPSRKSVYFAWVCSTGRSSNEGPTLKRSATRGGHRTRVVCLSKRPPPFPQDLRANLLILYFTAQNSEPDLQKYCHLTFWSTYMLRRYGPDFWSSLFHLKEKLFQAHILIQLYRVNILWKNNYWNRFR